MKNRKFSALVAFAFFCAAGLFFSSEARAYEQKDITSVCLANGMAGGERSTGMSDCLTYSANLSALGINAAMGGKMGIDSRYDTSWSGTETPIFKASRYRISDIKDVQKTQSVIADISDPNKIQEELKKYGGLYDFGTRSYFAPTYFKEQNPSYPDAIARAGLRLNNGQMTQVPVDVCGMCRYITNASGKDIFIPFRTCREWWAFTQNVPEGVTMTKCALPCAGNCEPGTSFGETSVRFDLGDEDKDTDPIEGETWEGARDANGNIICDKDALEAWGDNPQGEDRIVCKEVTYNNRFGAELPYAMSGAYWPPAALRRPQTSTPTNEHVFHYKCYDRTVQRGSCRTYKTDKDGNYIYDTFGHKICSEWNTKCVDVWHDWEEVWWFEPVMAGESGDFGGDRSAWTDEQWAAIEKTDGSSFERTDKGWPKSFSFHQDGGTRPVVCNTDEEHFWVQYGDPETDSNYHCGPGAGGTNPTTITVYVPNGDCTW